MQQHFTIGGKSQGIVRVDENSRLYANGNVTLGVFSNARGDIFLTGQGAIWAGGEQSKIIAGKSGHANINIQDGGVLDTAGDFIAGETSSSSAIITLTSQESAVSTLRVAGDEFFLGGGGSANVFVFGGGKLQTGENTLTVIGNGSSTASVELDGVSGKPAVAEIKGGWTIGAAAGSHGTLRVGDNATLDLFSQIIDAPINISQRARIGDEAGSNGTLEIAAGALSNAVTYHPGEIIIGRYGTGLFKVRSGKQNAPGTNFVLGMHSSGKGTLDVAGAGVEVNLFGLESGRDGQAEVMFADGATLSTNNVLAGANSTITFDDSTWKIAGSATLSGSVKILNGAMLASSGSVLDSSSLNLDVRGSSGADPSTFKTSFLQFSQSSSVLNVREGGHAEIDVLQLRKGLIAVDGAASSGSRLKIGTALVGDGTAFAGLSVADQGELIVDRGNSTKLEVNAQGVVQVSAAKAHVNGAVSLKGGYMTLLSGGQAAASKVAIDGGRLDVTGGSLVIGGDVYDIPSLANGTVLVRPGGQLQGAKGLTPGAILKGNLIVVGELLIGRSPGEFNVDGDVTLEPGSLVQFEIGGTTPEDDFDVLTATGSMTIDGQVLMTFTDGFAPTTGQTFQIASASTLGDLPDIAVKNLMPGWQYELTEQNGAWVVESLSDGVAVLPGDYNYDGTVDGDDYTVWRSEYGATGYSQADSNDDLVVNAAEYAVWRNNLGASAGTLPNGVNGDVAVPEPSAAILLSAWLFALLWQLRSIKAAQP